LPVKSTSEGIAFYVGKYVSKHVDGRRPEDKGVRLVEYGKAARNWNSRFAWHTPKAQYFRQKVAAIAKEIQVEDGGMAKALGTNWSFKYRFEIRRTILGDSPHEFDLVDWPKEFMEEIYRVVAAGQRPFINPAAAAVEIGLKDQERLWGFMGPKWKAKI